MVLLTMFVLGVAAIGASLLASNEPEKEKRQTRKKRQPQKKSTLEKNFNRLKRELGTESGKKIAILGQPGAGKSSLLKKMTKGKIVPLPVIGIHTDATNWADDRQCTLLSHYENNVFSDAPGYDTSSHPVRLFSSAFPFNQFDAFIFVIRGKLRASDHEIFRQILRSKQEFCIARSFSENLEKEEIASIKEDIRLQLDLTNSIPILFFSNRTVKGVKAIFNSI